MVDVEATTHEKYEEVHIGSKHKFLTVVDIIQIPKRNEKTTVCYCECGNVVRISYSNFRVHNFNSCGCVPKGYKHGKSRTKIYDVWKNMNHRCHKQNDCNYKKYGEKGIDVCNEWNENNPKGFENFTKWAYENGYKEGLTIDRINEIGDYSPSNCRVATYLEQNTHLGMLRTNKSGYKDVWFNKDSNRYRVTISVNNQTHYVGEYKTKKEAVFSRNTYIEQNNLLHKKQEYIGEDGYINGISY